MITSRLPSGAHVTDFFFFPSLVKPAFPANVVGVPAALGGVPDDPGGGVADALGPIAGDPFLPFAIDFSTSWNGSIDDGCATFASSFFTNTAAAVPGAGGGAFLKLGSFGLALGAEKNDESDLASFVEAALANEEEEAVSFFAVMGFVDVADPTAGFLESDGALVGTSSFRFFDLGSVIDRIIS